ncbi:histidine phosphatase family protein [Companilactobacillus pabuli]|jgi:probable phosphoglycerate mutase|uniref:Histidine phosphatase family protein n=1 Tax=Companilactobacillus pabuli TaxID=2714036 RepID=A0A7L7KZ58_9LACO|nr:histidine phosphatase family protein [Companilactobacillus pabuli]AKP03711.1 fructose-2,6-bisphosphatase [Companilactobacillus farciminis]AKS52016.1 fructose-2,6-bisphosphatase [Companilactobacillus farciminis]MDG5112924.1 histidine phosphatase family protein [Companilactobacillus pabuli]QMT84304.1 histidine phosphatase family protein [Companilactobacillus pabuli]GAQ00577.1 fructose-2,6-bisphosphatase [Companilactobacillus farciminis]
MTQFYFIRHGQTKANVLKMKQGTINSEITYLNDNGQKQAETLRDHFDISFADRIISSPLNRTKQTTEILNQKAQLPVSFDKRLLEISYGQWDGQKNADLRKQHPDAYNNYWDDVLPMYVKYAQDGETFDDVINRVHEFLIEATNKYPNDKIICVTHGFTIKASALDVLKPKDPMSLPEPRNTSVTKITSVSDKEFYLEYYNQVFN